jgi:2-polyprenyl-6-methoxyphenol hydroxylase-like FAD-dependent oxidoreductase
MIPDVVIVGGGPVGLAVAIATRQRGFSVLIADRGAPPIDKPCGEGLMPEGVATLARLGIQLHLDQAVPFRGIRFAEDGLSAEASFSAEAGTGLGLRRSHLHQMLVNRAADLGVRMLWGEVVDDLEMSGGIRIAGRKLPCRWVVGADGRGSRVRRSCGIRDLKHGGHRIGLRQHFRSKSWTDFVEINWHDRGQAVVTQVDPDTVCISILMTGYSARLGELIKLFPALCRRLTDARPSSNVRGALCGSFTVDSVVRQRIALVGDASGAVDALTGEGLSVGFRQALALADALAQQDLAAYQREHARINRVPRLMGNLMLGLGARKWQRRSALRLLGSNASLFSLLLGVHTGTLSKRRFKPDNAVWPPAFHGGADQAITLIPKHPHRNKAACPE